MEHRAVVAGIASLLLTATAVTAANYTPPYQPVKKPAFLTLPVGAVKPAGWLRDWAWTARNGLTGHIDEYHAVWRDAWKGIPVDATIGPETSDRRNGWPLEQCADWLGGLVPLAYQLEDTFLINKVKARLDRIIDNLPQSPKYQWMFWQTSSISSFDELACSILSWSMWSYYSATREERILRALTKVYAGWTPQWAPWIGAPGLCLTEVGNTYSVTGNSAVLSNIKKSSSWWKSQYDPWAKGTRQAGNMHGNFWQWGVASPIALYPWSGDTNCILGPLANYRWLDTFNILPFGANSSQEQIAGIGPFRSTETCDIWTHSWAQLMFYRNTGDRVFGDGLELAFFNAAPAAVTRSFDSLVYFQQPNRLPRPTVGMTSSFGFDYQKIQFVLCCNGMVNNLIPGYIANMWMATHDNGLAATLYGPCTVHALAGDSVPVDLTCATGYPFEESVVITVTPQRAVSFPLYVRIPAWCSQASISVNGQAQSAAPDSRGFACVNRNWNTGDKVTLVFPMQIRCLKDTCTPPVARMPYECIYLGPLQFALPIPELNGNPNVADDSKTTWRCALNNDGQHPGADMAIERSALKSPWVWPYDAPVRIKTPVVKFDWKPKYASNLYGDGNNPDNQSLPASLVTSGTPDSVYLTPYGCSKFHVSMFPATQRSWEKALPIAVKQDTRKPAEQGLSARVVRSGNAYVLTYTIPATETNATIELFGLGGRRLCELGSRTTGPGTHTVPIRQSDGESGQRATGVYMLRIRSGQFGTDVLVPQL